MGLQRDRFKVYVQDADENIREVVATITHQDMVRGEAAHLGQPGVNLNHALALTTAWCWASLMRQGDYAGPYSAFRDADCQGVVDMEPVTVDPTVPTTTDA